MISAILYGRNDSYGYNLHKRAALSLNCIAEVLTDPQDEILFVDYNTPDDYPTFPEAIQDTLTDRAKEMLRILRVRSTVHSRYRDKTHLFTLEPIARNIAVRRSNPESRWILSTNTDMIFVPNANASLSDIVMDLPRGYYHLPRFELPETLWETFDRKDASGAIDAVRYWARATHLNEIVLGAPSIRFDAPGDFQLIQRDDLFRVYGFDEDMLLGWHVDSNIAKRLYLIYGKVGDLTDQIFGYHCDHTRQVTPMHRRDSAANDMNVFIETVTEPEKRSQAATWGCPGEEIEEIRLAQTRNWKYLNGLKSVIKEEMSEPTVAAYVPETYDKVSYSAPHILPFLADIFVNVPPGMSIGWIGAHREMFELFEALWRQMGFGGPIFILDEFKPALSSGKNTEENDNGLNARDVKAIHNEADALIFDFYTEGSPDQQRAAGSKEIQDLVLNKLLQFVYLERTRLDRNLPPRRFVCVNAIHNRFESVANALIGVSRTPFSSRIRQGFVSLPEIGMKDWSGRMSVGDAGVKLGSQFWAKQGKSGNVLLGPHTWPEPGIYRVKLKVRLDMPRHLKAVNWLTPKFFLRGLSVAIVVIAGEKEFARKEVSGADLALGVVSLEFEVKPVDFLHPVSADFQMIIWTGGLYAFCVERIEVDHRPTQLLDAQPQRWADFIDCARNDF